MKNITLEDFYKIDKLISEVEELVSNTVFDDERFLLNYIRSYVRIKRQRIDDQ